MTRDRISPGQAARLGVILLALWLVPVVAAGRGARLGQCVFPHCAVLSAKMAVVTFGGAYAVLAYVAQQAVEHLWLAAARRDAGRARHGRDHARDR
jgi:chromate transporter